ncbi:hypothetical protein SAMN06295885_2428 [Rathayibacter oskolensis]|uniref:Uncharacterized protein n=1 Tax=Rathayibacter oskolensis TaxID=1891671 RepID=A0A1X7P272_9MICO|nr:hypothetical protein SAMN06295885_2428 [Rathayibacter oskolensis]
MTHTARTSGIPGTDCAALEVLSDLLAALSDPGSIHAGLAATVSAHARALRDATPPGPQTDDPRGRVLSGTTGSSASDGETNPVTSE